ncbi:MAG TPA: sigma 54-interacting transcriptional regulator [Bacteroidota bacterium]|jgi:Nif-specific regulatory protein|nr:sigma 54-interacting transcriptional regulator [Bacteroidota bacterium]
MQSRLESFIEISNAINSVLELDRLLETIMDKAIAMIGVERGILFLKSSDGGLVPHAARNIEKETLADAEDISRSITTEVAASGKYFLSSNIQDDPNTVNRPSVKAFKIRSILCVPLLKKDAIIGTLYLDSRKATKDFTLEDVQFLQTFANLAAVAIENARLYEASKKEASYWKEEAAQQHRFENIVYASEKIKECLHRVKSVARSSVSVLVTGESGTGKELIARALHYNSERRDKKFVPINCSALPEQILEAELFGARKGAYTGSVSDSRGLFEEADGGTIFFDEIADMQPNLQAKLLRVLQEGEIRRVGDTHYRFINVRVLSATNKNVQEEISEGNFREDLYYRLCGMEIHLPPLRERPEDLLPLTQHFIREFSAKNKLPAKQITPDAIAKLKGYAFPGNVRELQNIISKAILLSQDVITSNDIDLPSLLPLPKDVEDFGEATRRHIVLMLEKVGWNQTRAAELLGLNRTTLQAKMKKLKIQRN